jgi:hypothetical protein
MLEPSFVNENETQWFPDHASNFTVEDVFLKTIHLNTLVSEKLSSP